MIEKIYANVISFTQQKFY